MKRIALLLCLTAAILAVQAMPRVSLLTAMPGEEVYALEGHSAIRVHDPDTGEDYVVNWGVYDFSSPNFVGRFVAGQTDYMCVADSFVQSFINSYTGRGRQVVEQVLDLDPTQTAAVIDLMRDNLRPQNATYRYNYVKDNCATRPLNIIESALGRRLLDTTPSATTFRKEMRRFHADYPWYQFGIDLALGSGIDYDISEHEAAFSPVTLMNKLAETGIVSETIVYGRQTLVHEKTPWWQTPMFAALLILALAIAATWTGRCGKLFDTLLFGVFFILGTVITYLMFVSEHEATSPNLLIMWLNPLCLLGAVLPWIKSAKKAEYSYFFVNFALLILLTMLSVLSVQSLNAAFWPLILADALRSIANMNRCRKTTKHS